MAESIRVSAVIPAYNRADSVGESIRSVLSQTRPPDELIVVDDGSTDRTWDVLSSFGDSIRAIRQDNAGVSAARNTGIQAARHPWIAFLDSDDVWAPQKIEWQLECIRAHPDLVTVVGDVVFESESGSDCLFDLRGRKAGNQDSTKIDRPLRFQLAIGVFSQSMMVRKSVLDSLGCFDESLHISEDTVLFAKVALAGAWGVVERPIATVRRLDEDTENLSSQRLTHPMRYYQILVDLYEWLERQDLSTDERADVRRRRRGAAFDLCKATHQERGEIDRSLLWRSVGWPPSPRTALRCALPLVIGAKGFDLVTSFRNRRAPSFERTSPAAPLSSPVSTDANQ